MIHYIVYYTDDEGNRLDLFTTDRLEVAETYCSKFNNLLDRLTEFYKNRVDSGFKDDSTAEYRYRLFDSILNARYKPIKFKQ